MSMSAERRDGPLSAIRVIELGSFIAGPYCGQLLADLGAEVIKVEPPGQGDPMRQWGARTASGHHLWWPVIGRNKRCITLDLRQARGQELARRLISKADVLVENFRPGQLESWSLDPADLRREHPRLIVARVSGFGQQGPYRTRAGFAAVAEAMGGLRALTGYPDRPPTRVGISIGDTLAGLHAALGVVASLFARDAAGSRQQAGQVVDVAITDSVISVLESVLTEYSANGRLRERTGTALPGIAPSNLYATADGSWIIVAANADGLFTRLATAMGRPELARDERYATHDARGRNQAELDAIVGAWTASHPRDALLAMLHEHGIPAGPVYDAGDVIRDPHFRERESVVDVPAGEIGTLSMQGIVPKLSETPGRIRWTGPALGAHTHEVFSELLGLTAAELDSLRHAGVI